ncbi:MAG TPA: PIG-L deacetylase family protein [Mycobacteriales bacterium]|jgi:LmbE family N-acetylglucosaminyl deacetylase|nr:PIG-L deacetylase family protein [Mycobacteriales bacterium]
MTKRRALAVFAHPDDVDFGAAGTVARWVQEGWDVRYVCATRGQKGAWDAHMDVDEYGDLREAEQRAAAKVVGVDDVTFLDFMDSEVFDNLELRLALSREFRRHRPHRLLTMVPDPLPTDAFVNHPDHRAIGQCALDITMTGGTTASIFPELLSEGLQPWRELEETWLMGPGIKARAVDVTDTVDVKLEALHCHSSQIGDRDIDTFVRRRLRDAGRTFGMTYAETFRVIGYRR